MFDTEAVVLLLIGALVVAAMFLRRLFLERKRLRIETVELLAIAILENAEFREMFSDQQADHIRDYKDRPNMYSRVRLCELYEIIRKLAFEKLPEDGEEYVRKILISDSFSRQRKFLSHIIRKMEWFIVLRELAQRRSIMPG